MSIFQQERNSAQEFSRQAKDSQELTKPLRVPNYAAIPSKLFRRAEQSSNLEQIPGKEIFAKVNDAKRLLETLPILLEQQIYHLNPIKDEKGVGEVTASLQSLATTTNPIPQIADHTFIRLINPMLICERENYNDILELRARP